MTSLANKKHEEVCKPQGGRIHRNEFAILGAPCGIIQNLSQHLADRFSNYRVGYIDAAHNNAEPVGAYNIGYTDKIDFHEVKSLSPNLEYEFRSLFSASDLVLVNGNHFKAQKQLVLINEKKKASLERKLDRLTHVLGFILDEGQTAIHDYLRNDFSDIPVLTIENIDGIVELIQREITVPIVKGLVLAGGKSVRMGMDKGSIDYHGLPQREYTARLLSKFCSETYISINQEIDSGFDTVADTFTELGPYGGILSAFRKDPNAAWLVVATDIPLLDESSIDQLISERNPSKVATCFHNPETNFPEPLITLWEPRAYPRLLEFLAAGYSCPRKALINSDIEELHVKNPDALKNANTPEERFSIKQLLEKK
jgi:molybdopterin-guanine dinucleotide biosynthesis protein A